MNEGKTDSVREAQFLNLKTINNNLYNNIYKNIQILFKIRRVEYLF